MFIETPFGALLAREGVESAELVAVRIAQIRDVVLAEAGVANAWRVLDCGPAVGNARGVPGVHCLGAAGLEADGRAIAVTARFTVDRRADAQRAFARHPPVRLAEVAVRANPESAQRRVIEF